MPRLTQAEKEARRSGIGSSDVPMILGISSHGGSFDVFNEKIGLADEEGRESEQMELGHDLEPFIARWYELRTGAQLVPGGTFAHKDHPWARATIDFRILGRSSTLEVKNVGGFMAKHWDDSVDDGVPHAVRAQTVWQAGIAAVESVDVAAMLGGMKRRIFTIPFDAELFRIMFEACQRFLVDHVLTGEPPPPDGSDAARHYLDDKYPTNDAVVIPVDNVDADRAAKAYFEAAILAKGAEKVKKIATQEAIRLVGEHAGIERTGQWRFSYKANRSGKRTPRWTNLAKPEEEETE